MRPRRRHHPAADRHIGLADPLVRHPTRIAAVLDIGLPRSGLVRTAAALWPPSELLELVTEDWIDHPTTHWRSCASFPVSDPDRNGRAAVQARGGVSVHATHRVVLTAYPRRWTTLDLC